MSSPSTSLAQQMKLFQAAELAGWGRLNPAVLNPNYNNRWEKRHVSTKLMLAEKGIGPDSVVFIAEANPGDADLMFGEQTAKPAVCDVTGVIAARLLAEGSHRLATEEEITRFREEQIEREKKCEGLERSKPENRKNTERIVERTVVLSPAEAKRQGIVAERE